MNTVCPEDECACPVCTLRERVMDGGMLPFAALALGIAATPCLAAALVQQAARLECHRLEVLAEWDGDEDATSESEDDRIEWIVRRWTRYFGLTS